MSSKQWVQSGETIFREGDPGDYMYVVARGAVRIHKNSTTKGPITLADIGPGDFFGEMVIMGEKRRTAAATATTDTDLMVFRDSDLAKLIRSRPDVAERMIRSLVKRIKTTTDKLVDARDRSRPSNSA